MKEYKDYQSKLSEVEKQENEGSDAAEQHVPALFLLVGAFISAAATYYLNEAGMKNSPLYAMTIGRARSVSRNRHPRRLIPCPNATRPQDT